MSGSTVSQKWTSAVLGLLAGACGTQFADPIAQGTTADPCLAWKTAAECNADIAHGCAVQPNQTGCLTTAPDCPPQTCQGGDAFVRRSGQSLSLHDAPFQFVGVNNWGIAWDSTGCRIAEFSDQTTALVRMFDDLVALGARVARIWAFQPYAGSSGTDYSHFDEVVTFARRANVRLVFVLENGRADNCSKGGLRDDAWFTSGYASPYDKNLLAYPDYVEGVVTHFKDEPTILGWELIHEAGATDFAALDGFVGTMSARIRNIDPNHLISVGVDGGIDGTATSRVGGATSNYAKLHDHTTVDLVDNHQFIALDDSNRVPQASDDSAESIAHALNKAVFLGALAIPIGDANSATLARRAAGMQIQIDAAFLSGVVGTLLYDYYPDWQAPTSSNSTFSFDTRPSDPLGAPSGVMVTAAQKYNKP